MLLRALMVVLTLVAPAANRAEACTCIMSPTNCSSLLTAAAVFEGTVESIELVSPPPPPGTKMSKGEIWVGGNYNHVTFTGVRSWRGEATTTITTDAQSSACGYSFEKGTRYLVVAYRDARGRVATSICSQTRPLEQAAELIDYLKASERNETRVWGRVYRASGPARSAEAFTPVTGAVVTLHGPREVVTSTDNDGRFVLIGLAHGSYSATAREPRTNAIARAVWAEFELSPGMAAACAALEFELAGTTTISGTVVDEFGDPIREAFVSLRSVKTVDSAGRGTPWLGIATDAEGRYVFSGLPPGNYQVVLTAFGDGTDPSQAETVAHTPSGAASFSLAADQEMALQPLVARRRK